MYVKCGSLVETRQVFNELHERDVVNWSVTLAGYTKCKMKRLASIMRKSKVKTISCLQVLKVCTSL